MTDVIQMLDSDVATQISRWESVADAGFRAVRDLMTGATATIGRPELEAVIASRVDHVRLEARRFVWASFTQNVDSLGAHLMSANVRGLWDLQKEERKARPRTRMVRWPWIPRWLFPKPNDIAQTIPLRESGRMHDALEQGNRAIREANEAARRFDAAFVDAVRWSDVARWTTSARLLLRNASAAARFLLIQVFAFAAAALSISWMTGKVFAKAGAWGTLIAALTAAALVAIVVRPYLRHRLRTRLRRAAEDLFLQWMTIQTWIAISYVARWIASTGEQEAR